MSHRLPNFFIAGTQKAGTTYLARMLGAHPEIYFSKPKELFLFGRSDMNQEMFDDYLRNYFSAERIEASKRGRKSRFIGEGSTTYFQSRIALSNMNKCLGTDFKAIVILRHPVEKLLSYYMHHYVRGRFDASKAIGDSSIARTSMYAKHLRRWIDDLGFERFFPMKFDSLRENPLEFVNSAVRFAGLQPLKKVSRRKINAGFEMVRRGDYVEPRFSKNPPSPTLQIPRFAMTDLADLQKRFLPDVKRTQALVGFDMTPWMELPEFRQPENESALVRK